MEIAILCGGKEKMGNVNKGLLKICGKAFVEVIYETPYTKIITIIKQEE